jgi:hypothetical protein
LGRLLVHFTTEPQWPPIHLKPSQQSALDEHLSSTFAHPVGGLHMPPTQKPVQQSIPVVHELPSEWHGLSVAKARMLPDASS